LAAALCPDPLRAVTPLHRLPTEFRDGTVGLKEGKGCIVVERRGMEGWEESGRKGRETRERCKGIGGKGGRKAENGP